MGRIQTGIGTALIRGRKKERVQPKEAPKPESKKPRPVLPPIKPPKEVKPRQEMAKKEKKPTITPKKAKPAKKAGKGLKGTSGKSFVFPAVSIGPKKGKVAKGLKTGAPQPATQVIARTFKVKKDN